MTALHVFDMDGTLLRGTTASLEVSRALGCTGALQVLEDRFAAGAGGSLSTDLLLFRQEFVPPDGAGA